MSIQDKEKYRLFSESDDAKIPIFFNPWYLDIVCQKGAWDVIIYEDGNEGIAGFLVFYTTKKYGRKGIIMPPLTPYSGIWLNAMNTSKVESNNKKSTSIIQKLIEGIPQNISLYTQSFHSSFNNGLPFYWKKYTQTVRYTFYIENLKEWTIDNIATNARNKIKKASKNLIVEASDDKATLYHLVSQVMNDKGMQMTLTREMFFELDEAILKHSKRRIFLVKDTTGYVYAATYMILDVDTAYLMMIGSDKNTRQNGAVSLAINHCILEAQLYVEHFDFEGSMLESIFDLFSGFGGNLKPYYRIYKAKNIFWDILYRLKNYNDQNIR
jgi:hypothetical protein